MQLSHTLGHSYTEVSARYGHLVPGEFSETDHAVVDLDLREGELIPLAKSPNEPQA